MPIRLMGEELMLWSDLNSCTYGSLPHRLELLNFRLECSHAPRFI